MCYGRGLMFLYSFFYCYVQTACILFGSVSDVQHIASAFRVRGHVTQKGGQRR